MYMRLFPLSDNALTVEFGDCIREDIHHRVMALVSLLHDKPIAGVSDLVPAYCSLTIFYDILLVRKAHPSYATAFAAIQAQIEAFLPDIETTTLNLDSRLIRIPVCYSPTFGWDWEEICQYTDLEVSEIIRIHTSASYKVYMMGFLPGFPYLGGMNTQIAAPRKTQPRTHVPAGSVGIAGNQTGIYPLLSPGGWQLIGRTPTHGNRL